MSHPVFQPGDGVAPMGKVQFILEGYSTPIPSWYVEDCDGFTYMEISRGRNGKWYAHAARANWSIELPEGMNPEGKSSVRMLSVEGYFDPVIFPYLLFGVWEMMYPGTFSPGERDRVLREITAWKKKWYAEVHP